MSIKQRVNLDLIAHLLVQYRLKNVKLLDLGSYSVPHNPWAIYISRLFL